MYIKKGVGFCPLIRGGHQEKGKRAGTENLLGIVSLGAACRRRQLLFGSIAAAVLVMAVYTWLPPKAKESAVAVRIQNGDVV